MAQAYIPPDTGEHPQPAPAGRRLKILMLAPFAPDICGPHGGARAIAASAEALGLRHDVRLIYLRKPDEPPPRQLPDVTETVEVMLPHPKRNGRNRQSRVREAMNELAGKPPAWVIGTASQEMDCAIRAMIGRFDPDVVHMEFHVMAQYLPTLRAAAPDARCIVTEHEPGVASETAGLGNNLLRRLRLLASGRAWSRFERDALPKTDAIVTFTNRDRETLCALLGKRAPLLACIPLRIPPPALPVDVLNPPVSDLLFIGNFVHPPNVDSAMRLIRSIFPKIRAAKPDAQLVIVGANPPASLKTSAGEGVTITGWVEDAAPYLAGTKLVMAPLRLGGGMRVKVIEACAIGKALLATSRAIEGLPLRDGIECAIEDDDNSLAARALALLAAPEVLQNLGTAAKDWADGWLTPETWVDEYDALYRRLGVLKMEKRHAAGREALS